MPEKPRPNMLDQVIGYFSPSAALRRLAARRELEKATAPRPEGPRHDAIPRRDNGQVWCPLEGDYQRGDWREWR